MLNIIPYRPTSPPNWKNNTLAPVDDQGNPTPGIQETDLGIGPHLIEKSFPLPNSVQEVANPGIAFLNPFGLGIHANRIATALLGIPEHAFAGHQFLEWVSETDHPKLADLFSSPGKSSTEQKNGQIQTKLNGRTLSFNASRSFPDLGWFFVLQEKSEKTTPLVEELKEKILASLLLTHLSEQTPTTGQREDGYVLVDPDSGCLTSLNSAVHTCMGYTREEFDQLHLNDLISIENQTKWLTNGSPIHQNEFQWNGPWEDGKSFETVTKKKDGSERLTRVTARRIRIAEGSFQTFIWSDITSEKQIEIELLETQNRFLATFDFASIGMAIVSQTGRFLKVNQALANMVGYNQEELLEKSFQDLTHPEDLNEDLKNLNLLNEGKTNHIIKTKRYFHKSGRIIWTILNIKLVESQSRKNHFFVSHIQDITEFKESEAQLAESEGRFFNAFEYGATGQTIVSLDGKFLKVNPAFCEILGFSKEELLSRNIREFSHPDDMQITEGQIDKLHAGEIKNAKYRKRYIQKKGEIVWLFASVSLLRNQKNQPLYFVSQVTDITNQIKAIEALHESERRERARRAELETVLEAIPCLIWHAQDPELKTIKGNKATYEFLKLPVETNLSLNPSENIPKKYRFFQGIQEISPEKLPLTKAARSRALTEFEEHEVHYDDGAIRHIYGRAVPLFDFNGQLRGCIGAAVDITTRVEAERALAESRERLQFALEGSEEGVWDWNIQTGEVHFSKRWMEMLGFEGGEIQASLDFWSSRVHPEDLPKVLLDKDDYFQGKTNAYSNEHRLLSRDGKWQWRHSRGKLVSRDAHGNPLRMIGTHADISARKEGEANELARSKTMTMIANGAPLSNILQELVFMVERNDPNTRGSVLLLDPVEQKLRFGVGPNLPDFYNRAIDGLTIGPDVGSCGTAAHLGKRVIVENVFHDSKWVNFRELAAKAEIQSCWSEPIIGGSNEILGTFAIYHNMARRPSQKELETISFSAQLAGIAIEKKRAEEQVLANQRLLSEAERLSRSGAWVWYVNKNRCQLSDGLMRILGLPEREQKSIPMVLLSHPQDRGRLEKALSDLLSVGRSLELEVRIFRKSDGALRWIAINGILFQDTPEDPVIFGATQDITERKKAEEELAQRERELLRSNGDLQHFAYAASHDLKEPLRMVSSFTQLLAKKYGPILDEKAHQYIGFMVEGCTRMNRLIEDLLEYSRVDIQGKFAETVDCHAILQNCLKNLEHLILEAGLKIHNDPLPVVNADPTQVGQLFQNLISNSLKFRGQADPTVQIQVVEMENQWQFSLEDNGIGIPNQFYDKVFVLFQRLHTKDKYPGTGIGLALCKKIVERHGGQIWVEGPPSGTGTRICFTLPKATERNGQ